MAAGGNGGQEMELVITSGSGYSSGSVLRTRILTAVAAIWNEGVTVTYGSFYINSSDLWLDWILPPFSPVLSLRHALLLNTTSHHYIRNLFILFILSFCSMWQKVLPPPHLDVGPPLLFPRSSVRSLLIYSSVMPTAAGQLCACPALMVYRF